MSTVIFVLIGMAACGFTRGLFNSTLGGFLLDLCLGVIGAVAAGSLFNYYVGMRIAQLYIASGLIALSGAALLLAAGHAVLWVARYRQLDGRRVRIGGVAPLPSVPGAGHLHEPTATRLAGLVLGDRPIQTRTAWARLSSITRRSRSRRHT